MRDYVPDLSDIVWLTVDRQRGHEQAGRRPFIVLTPRVYNAKTSLMICCPITSTRKGYPFEVLLELSLIKGVVLADQVRSLDWRARNAKLVEKAPAPILRSTRRLLATLLGI